MNISNLTVLADYLEGVDDNFFDMGSFFYRRNTSFSELIKTETTYALTGNLPECGTTACALGYGPAAGFPMTKAESKRLNWPGYCERVFSLSLGYTNREWFWCFSANWARTQPTAKEAAARIRTLITTGVPDDYEG